MTFWLDWKLFGNGHGMASPYFDDTFYWLHDGGAGKRGAWYRSGGGLGAQLFSVQWTMPKPGERRKLSGYDFVVFRANRKGPRVEVAWSLVRLPQDINAANAFIAEMRSKLGGCFP